MLYSIKNVEELENLNELVSLQSQINEVRLQDKPGEQNFPQDKKKLFEPMTDAIKTACEILTKTIAETSIKNHKTIEYINEKVLELINDKGMIAPYLASSLVNLSGHEIKNQFRFKKDVDSTEMNIFLIIGGIPVTLYSNMLTFRDSKIHLN